MTQLYCGDCQNYLMGSDGQCHDCSCGWNQPVETYEKENTELETEVARLQKENAELKEDLQFVERWENHHGTKKNVTAQEALSVIQHYPSIKEITKSYKDGVIPDTRNPYAEIESLKLKKEFIENAAQDLENENAAQAKRIAELESAVKANHEWHETYDEHGGYEDSEMFNINTSALSAQKGTE